LWSEGYVHRIPYLDLEQARGGATFAYGLRDKGVAEYGGKTFDEHSHRTLDHELAITQFHLSLKRFSEERGLLLFWQQHDLKRTIHPDAYFSITDSKKDGRNTHHFFLEIERQRMGAAAHGKPSIIRKAERYYAYYNTNECEKDWGFKTFRVVFVQKNDVRRGHFLAVLSKDFSHRMFWLGTERNCCADFRTPKMDVSSFADL
jgi:hypothetical protein